MPEILSSLKDYIPFATAVAAILIAISQVRKTESQRRKTGLQMELLRRKIALQEREITDNVELTENVASQSGGASLIKIPNPKQLQYDSQAISVACLKHSEPSRTHYVP